MTQIDTYRCVARMHQYPSERATWYVVTLATSIGLQIYEAHGSRHRGFGSLPVIVTVGTSTWSTSIFRDARRKSYFLFLKASVRKREGLSAGDEIRFTLELV